jgi:hypothetical protein
MQQRRMCLRAARPITREHERATAGPPRRRVLRPSGPARTSGIGPPDAKGEATFKIVVFERDEPGEEERSLWSMFSAFPA